MFGENIKRRIKKGDGTLLDIQEIFPTFQGEGPYTGHPAVFVRLGGCNLACSFCDTEFESFKEMNLETILEEIIKLSKNDESQIVRKLVVITGGEPMRQPIELLCNKLIGLGYKVQIETNGTLYRNLHDNVKIIISPKASDNSGYHPIRDDLLRRTAALKFIISKHNISYSTVPELGQSKYNISVYLQPMDEGSEIKNLENLKYALELAEKLGYNYSLQTHKIIGIK